jgi:hypothetical protein
VKIGEKREDPTVRGMLGKNFLAEFWKYSASEVDFTGRVANAIRPRRLKSSNSLFFMPVQAESDALDQNLPAVGRDSDVNQIISVGAA